MTRWTCPSCEREFGRTRQSHVCVPAGTIDETFTPHRPEWRAIFDAILAHVQSLGPVHTDAVKVGVFLKTDRTLAEVRPRARAVDLMLVLPHKIDNERVRRTMRVSADLIANVVAFTEARQVDEEVRAWLTEAYDAASG
ncbi:DUF5655 domain-containing protein [Asanoa iriomotensis]|uniref:DUF5655 domain-containing protein n=1 Tax=Asanoa iriomotensis TaxID=234613 RepID=A0ABQ4BW19_9ACTN|nr:DUF5655 domain-containing protein [Asanoa iriomotensis]GIF54707.1 hypothetical protein Air01nite_08020 [Asanoa iriomotensis]